MTTQTPQDPPKNEPKNDPARRDEGQHRQDPSRKSQGPNNPLPGEPGGPTTSGHVEPSEPKDKDRDREHDDRENHPSKR